MTRDGVPDRLDADTYIDVRGSSALGREGLACSRLLGTGTHDLRCVSNPSRVVSMSDVWLSFPSFGHDLPASQHPSIPALRRAATRS